ncbi:MAG: sulfotransferase [Bacteroidetes bacterium]|nr:sulfotransferase [Bacteroidota bacterium]
MPKKELLREYSRKYADFQKEKTELLKFRFKEISYERLVDDKMGVFKEICNFCELDFSPFFQKKIASWEIYQDSNATYQKYLTPEEEHYLNDLIQES